MSAYVVEKSTIDKIVTYIDSRRNRSHNMSFQGKYRYLAHRSKSELGTKLLEMNTEAVNQRYNESNPAPEYEWSCNIVNNIQLLKALRCFLYQCSEGDVLGNPLYEDLRKLEMELLDNIVSTLPEYEAAVWG